MNAHAKIVRRAWPKLMPVRVLLLRNRYMNIDGSPGVISSSSEAKKVCSLVFGILQQPRHFESSNVKLHNIVFG